MTSSDPGSPAPPAAVPRPLEGLRVLDCATLFAGPVVATIMGDFGADVIKVEHPRGDGMRSMGWSVEGTSLWWALISRNKRSVTLKLSDPEGAEILKRLAAEADVLIENFRPGTLEKWGLGPEVLHEVNPGLVIVRTTGFGQTGPYRSRAGFGTLAEAISGYAHINGWPDKPPALPPFALGDGIAALTGCFSAMFALWWREHGGAGRGQVIDISIFEPLFWILGPQALVYDRLGEVQGRTGNAAPFTAPRNAYQARDGRWLALSASAQSIAERVMEIIGHPEIAEEPWFRDHDGRLQHAHELDELIADWIGRRSTEEVLAAFEAGEAAIAPVYTIEDILADPQYAARETLVRFEHPRLGSLLMQGMMSKLSETPGRIATGAPSLGEHTDSVLAEAAGLDAEAIAGLRQRGVIA